MKEHHRASWLALAAGVALVALVAIDTWILGNSLLAEGIPKPHRTNIARSLGALVCSALMVGAIASFPAPARRNPWTGLGRGAWIVAAMHLAGLAFLGVLWISGSAFHGLAVEGKVVESFSFSFCVLAAGLLTTAVFFRRGPSRAGRLLALAVAAALMLVALEEVSWFQHQIQFETPPIFRSNQQGESNLHNFATAEIENLYYVGSFLFLILLPAVLERRHATFGPRGLDTWLPGRLTMLTAAAMAPLNYDMWRGLPTQLVFFVSVLLMIEYALRNGRRPEMMALPLIMVAVQLGFLAIGDRQARMYDVTEYKELVIPLGYLVYAIEVLGSREGRPDLARTG